MKGATALFAGFVMFSAMLIALGAVVTANLELKAQFESVTADLAGCQAAGETMDGTLKDLERQIGQLLDELGQARLTNAVLQGQIDLLVAEVLDLRAAQTASTPPSGLERAVSLVSSAWATFWAFLGAVFSALLRKLFASRGIRI